MGPELGMLADLAACSKTPPPVLPALLSCPPGGFSEAGSDEPTVHLTHEAALAHAQALANAARLNAEQTRCLQHAACWLSNEDRQQVQPSKSPYF